MTQVEKVDYLKWLEERQAALEALMLGRATGRQFVLAQVSYEEWKDMKYFRGGSMRDDIHVGIMGCIAQMSVDDLVRLLKVANGKVVKGKLPRRKGK
jgi:hypothetical protein